MNRHNTGRQRYFIRTVLLSLALVAPGALYAAPVAETPLLTSTQVSTSGFWCGTLSFITVPLGFCPEKTVVILEDASDSQTVTSLTSEPAQETIDPDITVTQDPTGSTSTATTTPPVVREAANGVTNVTNQYITNPTTVIREVIKETEIIRDRGGDSSSDLDESEIVSRTLFNDQVDTIYDAMGDSANGLSDSLAEAVATNLLTVSGNGTLTGSLTAGTFVSAPYFTATDGLATSTLAGSLTIGTTTSLAALTLDGAAYLAPITSPADTTNRLYNQANSLYWNGSVVAGASVGSWGSNGTDVYRVGGNVGIGTTAPGQELEVNGDILLGVATPSLYLGNDSDQYITGNAAANYLSISTANAERIRINSSGNVGIGTNSPAAKLHISGGNDPLVQLSSTVGNYPALRFERVGQLTWQTGFEGVGGPVGANAFTIKDITNSKFPFSIENNSPTGSLVIKSSGNVGIGTTTPTQTLDIGAGSMALLTTTSATSGIIFKGADRFIHNFNLAGTDGQNTFVGINAGNFTMTGSTGSQGSFNTGIGRSALQSNTTGSNNTANGRSALLSNTTGAYNTGIGVNALLSNTTGNFNTANGVNALRFNTTGDSNIATGYQAGYDLTTGDDNTFLGYNTGRGITTGSNNTILGANVTGLAAGLSNNIILADGAGNQRLNITSTGNVGIGTTTPGYTLDVADSSGATLARFKDSDSAFEGVIVAGDVNGGWIGNSAANSGEGFYFQDNLGTGGVRTYAGGVEVARSTATSNIFNEAGADIDFRVEAVGESNALFVQGNTGNVGIGTTAPEEKLDVRGSVVVPNTSAYKVGGAGDTFVGKIGASGGVLEIQTDGTRDMQFGGVTGGTAMFIDTSSGNVGIGTSTPTERLSVAGNINLTGDLLFNGTALGINSLSDGRVAGKSVFLGTSAGANDDGTDNLNVGIGESALQFNTTGFSNVATGHEALRFNTVGSRNTASGFQALLFNTTGGNNAANGYQALRTNTTGVNNSAIGYQALYSNTTGNENISNGVLALYSNTTGSNNIATGRASLYDLTTGSNNLALGYNTGRGITTGSNNTILGANVTGLAATLSNNIIIADGAGNRRINVDGSGNVGIGTTNPSSFKLQVAGNVGPNADNTFTLGAIGSDWECIYYEGGNLGTCASDRNLKTNITDLTYSEEDASTLEKLSNLQVRSFEYKAAVGDAYNGLIAQEVLEAGFDELVTQRPNGYLAVKYGDLQWVVIESIQELWSRVQEYFTRTEQLEETVEELKAENEAFKARFEALEGDSDGDNDSDDIDEPQGNEDTDEPDVEDEPLEEDEQETDGAPESDPADTELEPDSDGGEADPATDDEGVSESEDGTEEDSEESDDTEPVHTDESDTDQEDVEEPEEPEPEVEVEVTEEESTPEAEL